MSNPPTAATHACDVPDLDYSNVLAGRIFCSVCGRWYVLTSGGWVARPRPLTKYKPRSVTDE